MKTSRTIIALVAAGSLALLAGCQNNDTDSPTTQSASMGMLNDACPISGNAVKPNVDTSEFGGNTIGFCCNGCKANWDGKSDTYKKGFVASQK